MSNLNNVPHASEEENDKYSIKTVDRLFQVLDCFTETNGPLGVTELQKKLGINVNLAFRLLYSIEKAGYIRRDDTGKYTLSLKTLKLSQNALNSLKIRRRASQLEQQLALEYPNANITLMIKEGDNCITVDRINSLHAPRSFYHIGKMNAFHTTAGGKILLSGMSDEEIKDLISRVGLDFCTEASIRDIDTLLDEINEVRHQGIAWERSENTVDYSAIAAPVRDKTGEIIAAICITGFDIYVSVQELEAAIPRLKQTGYMVSELMGYLNE